MDRDDWRDYESLKAEFQARLNRLLEEVAACNMVVDVQHWPLYPLAMGKFKTVGEVRDSLTAARERMKG